MNVMMVLLGLILIFCGGWFITKAVIDIEKYKGCDHFEEGVGTMIGLLSIVLGIIFVCLISVFF